MISEERQKIEKIIEDLVVASQPDLISRKLFTESLNERRRFSYRRGESADKEKVIIEDIPLEKYVQATKNDIVIRNEDEWKTRVFDLGRAISLGSLSDGVYSKSVANFSDPKDGYFLKLFFKQLNLLNETDPEEFDKIYIALIEAVKLADAVALMKIIQTVMAGNAKAIVGLKASLLSNLSVVLVAVGTFLAFIDSVQGVKRNQLMSKFKDYKASMNKIFKKFPVETLKKIKDPDKLLDAIKAVEKNLLEYADNEMYVDKDYAEIIRNDISRFVIGIRNRTQSYFDNLAIQNENKTLKLTEKNLRKIIKEELLKINEGRDGNDVGYPGELGIGTGTGSDGGNTSGEETDLDSEIEATTSQIQALRSQGTSPTAAAQKNQLQRQLSMLQQKKAKLASE